MNTILYATMTGNARDCAEKLESILKKAGLPVQTHDLASYNPRQIHEESTVLLCVSTWGEGEPPDDGVNFCDYVKTLSAPALAGIRFAVFALGDTSYEQFCQCGKELDGIFEACGARRILDRVDNDIDYTDALEKWCADLVPALEEAVTA